MAKSTRARRWRGLKAINKQLWQSESAVLKVNCVMTSLCITPPSSLHQTKPVKITHNHHVDVGGWWSHFSLFSLVAVVVVVVDIELLWNYLVVCNLSWWKYDAIIVKSDAMTGNDFSFFFFVFLHFMCLSLSLSRSEKWQWMGSMNIYEI